MSTAKKTTKSATKSKPKKEKTAESSSSAQTTRTLYAEFSVWSSKKKPIWHPVKKMRYVFFRMIDGATISDALKEIRWSASEFWHLVDLERNAPFREEYKRARKLQGRAFGDQVVQIAEGRDKTTKQKMRRIKKLIESTLRRAGKQKSALAAKAVIEGLLTKLNENDAGIIARNKLQIDATKWLAKTANPNEFSEKSSVSVDGGSTPDGTQKAILVQFIDASGKVVAP